MLILSGREQNMAKDKRTKNHRVMGVEHLENRSLNATYDLIDNDSFQVISGTAEDDTFYVTGASPNNNLYISGGDGKDTFVVSGGKPSINSNAGDSNVIIKENGYARIVDDNLQSKGTVNISAYDPLPQQTDTRDQWLNDFYTSDTLSSGPLPFQLSGRIDGPEPVKARAEFAWITHQHGLSSFQANDKLVFTDIPVDARNIEVHMHDVVVPYAYPGTPYGDGQPIRRIDVTYQNQAGETFVAGAEHAHLPISTQGGTPRYPRTNYGFLAPNHFKLSAVDIYQKQPDGSSRLIIEGGKPVEVLDVDKDGFITALDALSLINRLNQGGAGPTTAGDSQDVNRDGMITAMDVVPIINHLNTLGAGPARTAANKVVASAESEGEYIEPLAQDVAKAKASSTSQQQIHDEVFARMGHESEQERNKPHSEKHKPRSYKPVSIDSLSLRENSNSGKLKR
jgi:hypothetical protein